MSRRNTYSFLGKKLHRRKLQGYFWGYIMILPTMAGLGLFYLWPLIQSFYLSLTTWGAFGMYEYGGFVNFQRMVQDPNVSMAIRNTFKFAVLSIPFSIGISTGIAVLLNQGIRAKGLYRTLYFLPVVTMPTAIAIVWQWLLNGDFGLVNHLLRQLFSIEGPRWLSDPSIALYSVVMVAVWSALGTNMIIILSGLQGISESYYEAADIDGASPLQKLFRITLPLLSPTLFFVTVTSSIAALQVFELIQLMIGQNSVAIRATQTLVYLFYREAFLYMDKGYASAISLLLLVIILSITVFQFRLQKRWVHYG